MKLVNLQLAKRLKKEGYSKHCDFYYQDKDLPYSKSGIKMGSKINHNAFDDFIYSAPPLKDALDWLAGKNMKYDSSLIIKLTKKY